ncbi:MAG: Ldh family oxidoreductase, partial [Planctomycetaceae bacterium]
LYEIAHRILVGAGVADADAAVVAGELRDANLVGHDSHGVMRLMQYVQAMDDGHADPNGAFQVVIDKPGFAVIDGHFHFGQVTATKALEIGIDGARRQGAFTVMIRNCNHVGRLGSYTEKAARQGIAALMTVNGPGPGGVAPYGGIDRRLGTNPISIAAPHGDAPFVLDMTTSITAEGKVRVALQKGEQLPEGWIIDGDGNPSTNPPDFYGPPEGAILPLGGAMGFKGFGLSVMIDVFAGMLSGSGVCRDDLPRGANGVWMSFLDTSQFLPPAEYEALTATYVAHIKSSRRMPGIEEILLPGEIEQRRRAVRERNGVDVPAETWRQINELATRFGVSLEDV